MDLTDKIIAYESGEMSAEETNAFFQELVDSGLAWELQGHYGRTASHLIDCGAIKQPAVTRTARIWGED